MQFKHPEILYALLLLIIPIIVHLFQLQRFVKVPFTNVKILKTIEKQTRKSTQLKKWLVLCTRLLIFTCLIFAFSQPYLSNHSTEQNFNTTIYLDNSYSMQVKGESGELLKSTAQNIIKNITNFKGNSTLITNTKVLENLDSKNLKNELITLTYSPNKLDLNTVLLKIQNQNSKQSKSRQKNILISDFQQDNIPNDLDFSYIKSPLILVKPPLKNTTNIYIDSVFTEEKTFTETTINVMLKSTQNITENFPVSLYRDSKLLGKTTSKFINSTNAKVQFTIPHANNFNGRISILDNGLYFDNNFYFSISKPTKINVLSIGSSSLFLPRIYTKNEFNFTTTPLQNLNYNKLQNQHLIILNELESIPNELIVSLKTFTENGGSLVIIPSEKSVIPSYNLLFTAFNMGTVTSRIERKQKITTINYEHPLLNNVFEKRVKNFQYPTTTLQYKTRLKNNSSIVKTASNNPFISSFEIEKNASIYWFSSPLQTSITDFVQSPLVVPVFYTIAKNSLKATQLYYTIADNNEIYISTIIGKDPILKVSNTTKAEEFIPLQTSSQNEVTLKLQDQILQSGFYQIFNDNNVIKTIAFNYNKQESNLNYANLKGLTSNYKNVEITSSIEEVLNKINNQQKINWLFKWFLAFSVLFLLIEMLLLKYFKI